MNTSMAVTNLRLPKDILMQIRVMAAEEGISANEYIKKSVEKKMLEDQLGINIKSDTKLKKGKKKQTVSLWDLGHIAEGMKYEPEEMSEEDKIIYDL